ncbi:MAG TPA: DUF2207 domain-containing protein [Candidatus Saccharibacteria bacterium]|nr:DUF2207 domain-containing protein [Candidatus Saccharibacteria bacterium]
MKRAALWVLASIAGVIGITQLSFAVTAVQASPTPAITHYDVKMVLGRDAERRSTLTTTETITVNFPPNLKRGITRNFVREYDGHATSFDFVSVTDEQGIPLEYNWNDGQLRVGSADVFVSGTKTYVLKYTQRDVTKYYADTQRDEFYWDAIGIESDMPVREATIALELDESIRGAVQTELQCYAGPMGAKKTCTTTGDLAVSVQNLAPYEGVTIALGFAPGTFAPYQQGLLEKLISWWFMLQIALAFVSVLLAILLIRKAVAAIGRKKELSPIVPEYLPPKDTSVMTAATLASSFGMVRGSVMVAQLLDLAVRHYIKLYEVKPKKLFQLAEYEVEIVKDLAELLPEEREIIDDMFGHAASVGETINLKKLRNNTAYGMRTIDDAGKVQKLIKDVYKLREHTPVYKQSFRVWSKWLLVLSVVLLSPWLLFMAGLAFGLSFMSVLSDKGLALRRYLEGLKLYIGVAETERLQMLQSPEGAEKVGGATSDQGQLVKLYERVLPYAVVFGQEKEWTKQMGAYYDQAGAQPDWYSGTSAFNAAVFVSSINSLGSVAASTSSSYSSSSGGSSGGGFSGGGGGGGGVGSW